MNAATAIHLISLAACFAAHLAFASEFDGVRRALQTMAGTQAQATVIVQASDLPAIQFSA